jgi:hypothetical protein
MPEAAGRPRPREVKAPSERSLMVRIVLLCWKCLRSERDAVGPRARPGTRWTTW